MAILSAGLREDTESLIYSHYGDSVSLLFKKITVPQPIKLHSEKQARLRFWRDQIYVWEISYGDSLMGLAYLDNVKGKSQPITFAVFLNENGVVMDSHIIKYREPIGGEIANRHWLKQFLGKTTASDYQVGKHIDGISGATISVNAVTRGIHRSTFVIQYLLEKMND
jgi:Na+-translocating ferredoxin:NAD+ oxidoreductase RnfG subunit